MAIDWSAVQSAEDKAAREADHARDAERNEARRYLAGTDWYVIRAADTGEPLPDAVRTRRADARRLLSDGRTVI